MSSPEVDVCPIHVIETLVHVVYTWLRRLRVCCQGEYIFALFYWRTVARIRTLQFSSLYEHRKNKIAYQVRIAIGKNITGIYNMHDLRIYWGQPKQLKCNVNFEAGDTLATLSPLRVSIYNWHLSKVKSCTW